MQNVYHAACVDEYRLSTLVELTAGVFVIIHIM